MRAGSDGSNANILHTTPVPRPAHEHTVPQDLYLFPDFPYPPELKPKDEYPTGGEVRHVHAVQLYCHVSRFYRCVLSTEVHRRRCVTLYRTCVLQHRIHTGALLPCCPKP